MLDQLNHWFSLPTLLWLFPAVFMVHDLEEIITVEGCLQKLRQPSSFIRLERAPKVLGGMLRGMLSLTSAQFATAVLLEFIVFIPVTYAAVERGHYYMFLGFNAIMLLHVLTHVAQSLYLRMYTPGVITAVVLTAPYSLYLFYRLIHDHVVSVSQVLWSIPAGLAVIPLVLAGFLLGRLVAPLSKPVEV